jgi:hypothetical protein
MSQASVPLYTYNGRCNAYLVLRSRAWWYTPLIPVLRRQKQEDHEFKISLGYLVRPSLKKKAKVPGVAVYTCNPRHGKA